MLYLHGFNDYFFQTHLADAWLEAGFDFYALDLRKYGRSLGEHQTPNYITSLEAYQFLTDPAYADLLGQVPVPDPTTMTTRAGSVPMVRSVCQVASPIVLTT